jgi:hypothetical protein
MMLEQQNDVQLNIRCASDSYNFDLRGNAATMLAPSAAPGADLPAMLLGQFPVMPKAACSSPCQRPIILGDLNLGHAQ